MIHEILIPIIKPGDTIVDATVGNGFDTLFLAKAVGHQGKVIGFDIQEKAIENAKKRLGSEGLLERVSLIHDSHSNIDQYVFQPIGGAMFNLGYLPGGSEEIITKAESTIKALEKTAYLLSRGGFITIISYWGHPGGKEEKEAVEQFLNELDNKAFITAKFNFLNRSGSPPIIYLVQKL
ncbi:MAG: methyltransferase domain-containing protein [Epulopiscium sp.]|nr:methyltransferase domain-containing protein [Candidatus Epulonipiscium sp.]